MHACVYACMRERGRRGVAHRRTKDCAFTLSTDAAVERVITMAEGSGGMNVTAGLGKSHPWNFARGRPSPAP